MRRIIRPWDADTRANVLDVLKAIAEGYEVKTVQDRYVIVENPKDDDPTKGEDPFILVDVARLEYGDSVVDREDEVDTEDEPVYNDKVEKYKHLGRLFEVPVNGVVRKVRSVDGELWYDQPSWSVGLTHLADPETLKMVSFCGIKWFEENAKEIEGG